MRKRRPGFTIIELLVAIAIIGILVAILLPAVQAAREAARRTSCANNLHNIGLAIHSYHNTHGRFPSGWLSPIPEGEPGWGWATLILPHMEQSALRNLVDTDKHIDDPANARARRYRIPSYFCASDDAMRQGTFLLEDDPDHVDPHDHGHLPIQLACCNYVALHGSHAIENPG